MSIRTITEKELESILENHKKWLNNAREGEQANLSNADLSQKDFSYMDLRYSNITNSNLAKANFKGADLRKAALNSSWLTQANLTDAKLDGACIFKASFHDVNLLGASLKGIIGYNCADFSETDIVTFSLGRDSALFQPETGYLIIGCEGKHLKEWQKTYKIVGDLHDYSNEEIELYGHMICKVLPRIAKL